jgi:hypothetical protein
VLICVGCSVSKQEQSQQLIHNFMYNRPFWHSSTNDFEIQTSLLQCLALTLIEKWGGWHRVQFAMVTILLTVGWCEVMGGDVLRRY